MIKLYDNAFSPFARKVRMVLEYKGLMFTTIDGLRKSTRDALNVVNERTEVPALDHDGLLIVNSSDIVSYLERVFPERPVYPASIDEWVRARAWERCADTVIDPILIDISYWFWAERQDAIPAGLREAAQHDLDKIYAALEQELDGRLYVCGALSIADLSLFPHMIATKALGIAIDATRFPRLCDWLSRMRALQLCKDDVQRTKHYLQSIAGSNDVERRKIFWRGDRIEWILARGYHEWFLKEIREERVLWPGLGIPAPRRTGAELNNSEAASLSDLSSRA